MGISHWRRGWDGCCIRRPNIGVLVGTGVYHGVFGKRLSQFFIANEIPTARKGALLLSVIGSRTYTLLRSLLHPEVPGDKTYEQLVTALQEHFEPKRLVVVERFHFNRLNQGNGESVLEYVAELKRLAGTYEFGAFLARGVEGPFRMRTGK